MLNITVKSSSKKDKTADNSSIIRRAAMGEKLPQSKKKREIKATGKKEEKLDG